MKIDTGCSGSVGQGFSPDYKATKSTGLQPLRYSFREAPIKLGNSLACLQAFHEKMRMKRLAIVAPLVVVVILSALACTRHQFPVLFHLSGSCACTDYSEEAEGLTVFNPFRDRSPEAGADKFLDALRQGRPLAVASDFRQVDWLHSVGKPLAFEWRLRHRRDQGHRVSLYYQFTLLDGQPHARWGGEGVVEVVDTGGSWKASNFDVIW